MAGIRISQPGWPWPASSGSPRPPWPFFGRAGGSSPNPRDVIQTYIEAEEPAPIEELHRDLSLHMHNSYAENRRGLEQLAIFFQIASGLLHAGGDPLDHRHRIDRVELSNGPSCATYSSTGTKTSQPNASGDAGCLAWQGQVARPPQTLITRSPGSRAGSLMSRVTPVERISMPDTSLDTTPRRMPIRVTR